MDEEVQYGRCFLMISYEYILRAHHRDTSGTHLGSTSVQRPVRLVLVWSWSFYRVGARDERSGKSRYGRRGSPFCRPLTITERLVAWRHVSA
ncbi:hypothetical protein E2C01_097916 [Portunus trituberculatus]|uniref:Uncharacterized protein n=1 Tax=Portunus trituberculatus TaxID=210409 RepID=A0A5B7KBH7_PORTR|nr:hypothetical protein [Portunus trituberculatus]